MLCKIAEKQENVITNRLSIFWCVSAVVFFFAYREVWEALGCAGVLEETSRYHEKHTDKAMLT